MAFYKLQRNLCDVSEISISQEYQSFRSSVPLKKVVVDDDNSKEWRLYDAGPKSVTCPLICLPPVSGTADIFFKQILSLSAHGCRVIAVEQPVYWTVAEWCNGFRNLLDYLGFDKVHIFGASLGGFLAQKFAALTYDSFRVVSLILCNTFCDTSVFHYTDTASVFWLTPSVMLKKLVMGSLMKKKLEPDITESVDFMVERLESLSQKELASRLTLNCTNCYVEPHRLAYTDITIIDVFDDSAISYSVKETLYKCYPHAKQAHLKTGGNFPYLSRPDEVNLHLLIHLRKYDGTQHSARDKEMLDLQNAFAESKLEKPSASQAEYQFSDDSDDNS